MRRCGEQYSRQREQPVKSPRGGSKLCPQKERRPVYLELRQEGQHCELNGERWAGQAGQEHVGLVHQGKHFRLYFKSQEKPLEGHRGRVRF